ncbi:uncharacterized protein [Ambystoma mexicanum]|uniref:uncharacterized protein n=1 Tax=Ambystoma mexicanum TaxID=8296 RepID=UPI0037E71930
MEELLIVARRVQARDAHVQWPEHELTVFGDYSKVALDHSYSATAPPQEDVIQCIEDSSEVVADRFTQSTPAKNLPPKNLSTLLCSPINVEVIDVEMTDNEPAAASIDASELDISDITFQCVEISTTSQAETTLTQDDGLMKESKYIVFDSCLMEIISMLKCVHSIRGKVCGKPLINVTRQIKGSNVKINAACRLNHRFSWSAQPMLGKRPAGNLLCVAASLFSGSSSRKLEAFFQFVGLHFISKALYYIYQRDYLFPAISDAWKIEQLSLASTFEGKRFRLAGDGQCDSPGFSAKCCTYHFQDMDSKKIVSLVVMQVTQCTSSVAMEKLGFIKSVEYLQSRGMHIDLIATDRHVSIGKTMREQFPHIKHQFDVWHLGKSINKKISAAGKKKVLKVFCSGHILSPTIFGGAQKLVRGQ